MRIASIAATMIVMGAAAQAGGSSLATYRAQGSDPDWTLTIDGVRARLERPGKETITVDMKPPQVDDGITHYESAALDVDIVPDPCTGATGNRYSDSVYLSLAGEELGGCGGAQISADSLNGTSWHFAEIGGEDTDLTGDVFKDDRYAIDFGPDSFVGYTGCNRFSGAYTQQNGILTVRPPFGMTKRLCAEPIHSRERKLIEILNSPVRISFPDPKTLLLTGDSGAVRLIRSTPD